MSAIPGYLPPVAALVDAEPSGVDAVPLLALPGGSHSLLSHALGMAVPVGLAPLGGAPSVDDVVPDGLGLDAPVIDEPADAGSWQPTRRLFSKTSFEMQ